MTALGQRSSLQPYRCWIVSRSGMGMISSSASIRLAAALSRFAAILFPKRLWLRAEQQTACCWVLLVDQPTMIYLCTNGPDRIVGFAFGVGTVCES